ncbi:MAG: ATP-binding protein [Eubacteriales bacterium]|nr:ATP-binding protein [Eubacteriales bacterium]
MAGNRSKIAVLSGKGGTGKTLISVNLAAIAGKSVYIDCDVEEPNGHLFFKPEKVYEEIVTVKIPSFDESLCNGCRICVDFCKFNALAFVKNKPFVFKEVCHSCGGCVLLCPKRAISEAEKTIGKIQKGIYRNGDVTVYGGMLNTGEASGIPVIKKLLDKNAADGKLPVFIDCPPGSACIVMESIKDADYCILVTEPTIFGAHNLDMVYNLVKLFKKPHAVIINKYSDDENPAEAFCRENNIAVLGRIPFDTELGTLNSDAKIAVNESERLRKLFAMLYKKVTEEL